MNKLLVLALGCILVAHGSSADNKIHEVPDIPEGSGDDDAGAKQGGGGSGDSGEGGGLNDRVEALSVELNTLLATMETLNQNVVNLQNQYQGVSEDVETMEDDLGSTMNSTNLLLASHINQQKGSFYVFIGNHQPGYVPGKIIKFDQVAFAGNGDFDVNTGKYTVPVTGVYVFKFCARTSGTMEIQIRTDSPVQTIGGVWGWLGLIARTQCYLYNLCGNGMAYLQKGDKVWAQVGGIRGTGGSSRYLYGYVWTHFMGFLLRDSA